MNVWTSSSRLATSSRHVGRFLLGECSSARVATGLWSFSIRNKALYSTDAPPEGNSTLNSPEDLLQPSRQETLPPKPDLPPTYDAWPKSKGKLKDDRSDSSAPVSAEAAEGKESSKSETKSMRERRKKRRRKAAAAKEKAHAFSHKDSTRKEKFRGPQKSSKGDALTFDSQLIPEHWQGEPWSTDGTNADTLQPSDDYRSPPPHVVPTSNFKEGSIETTGEDVLIDVAPRTELLPVARLAHNLDRTLFNPGVHWLRDPRSHVYNYTPWLERIPKVNDFAFERLTGFIKSSRDEDLRALAKQEDKKYAGSTSSLSGMLSHIYFLLSEYKEADCTILSQHFKNEPSAFTAGQRMPTTWDDPDKNVLTWLGTLLENFLTKSPEEFKQFMRIESAPIENDEKPKLREAFRFAKSDKFVMRSQLDCQDDRLPGTGVFDIKTRACVSIRMDILNFEENAGYLIRSQHGIFESFEREYYDLIRSAFLKYTFQVRIGNMDGVMVTYHNTERIFGFQYISRDEMDERLFGPTPGIGDKVFNHSIRLLEATLEEASQVFPEQSVLCGFETRMPGKVLDVFVQPAEWEGEEEERPIVKLAVTLEHELNGTPVKASSAMRAMPNDEWKVTYKISRVSLPDFEIRNDYKQFIQRKKRSLVLPSGVPLEEAEKFWNSLNFGNKTPEEVKLFRPESFTLANAAIEKYRELAREGRMVSQKMEEDLAGRPKIVLGSGVYEENTEERNSESEEPRTVR
ncbi:mitochondrial protein Pet127-domain-containing protein [Gymnopilus junonius]|uniref:Mitochondrial protein Pet127-domain-containing protein n=1 Tax=Gymnopilus junonius TaxID=109634 RepID=A0A9P5TSH6_GYMJU|nr:mitochondrial protein Pet127-domain-containing protein [Gymnopilus junonius]